MCEIFKQVNEKIINNNIFYEGSILEWKTEFKDIKYNENKLIEKMNKIIKIKP